MTTEEEAAPVAATDAEDARDLLKRQLRFTLNEYCTNMSDSNVPLTRCYWDQSAFLQSEWSQPLLGKYEGITWQNVAAREGTKNGVLPMGIDDFMENANDFLTDGALAILMPYSRAKFHSKNGRV